MAIYALVNEGVIIQISSTTFEVASPMAWTSDISSQSPIPQYGWTATENNGAWSFASPTVIAASLSQQASDVLPGARDYVYNNYGILNEATPDAWVTYLKALMAIANGTDTTSTSLPSAPSA